jgi:hypothetical protein
MGIYYGDIHYGIKITKKSKEEEYTNDDFSIEPIYKIIFDNHSILLDDYLDKIKDIYLNTVDPNEYTYELFVDIFSTHNGITKDKGWQRITMEQMNNFINGKYTINYVYK